MNAQVSYRVAKPLLLTVDVFNVFDVQVDDIAYWYTSRISPDPTVKARDDVHFHPAEKRSVRLTASVFF